jgi:hypothetical protein
LFTGSRLLLQHVENILKAGQPMSPRANKFQTVSFAGPLDHRGGKIGTYRRAWFVLRQEVLERTNLPTFLTLFKNVICIKTSVCVNITLVGISVPILKHSHVQNTVSNKRIVGSSWFFTILNFNCLGTTANSCISGSLSFIIFLYFLDLRRKLSGLQKNTLHKITEFYTEWFSVYPNLTSKFRTIAIFKNRVKQNNDSNKTYRYVYDLLQY